MKLTIATVLALLSFSSFADVEFFGKQNNETCTIVKNKVTKTVKFLKGTAGFTTTSTIETFGIEALATKAAAASTGRTMTSLDYAFTVKIDGVTSTLHFDDSVEAATLTQFMMKACF